MSRKKIFRMFAVFMFIVFLISLSSVSLAQEGKWTTKSDMPTARYGLSTSEVNGKIYAIGGRAGGQWFATVEEYDPVTNTWTRKADMPTARLGLSTGVVSGKIYAMGGVEGGIGPTKIVEEYDPATDTWRRRTDLPTKRERFSASVVDGRIYAISGFMSGSPVVTVDEYDPATDTWRARANMPTARPGLSTSVVDGKIYAIGGFTWDNTTNSGTYFATVEEYDPATDTWTMKADMPTARQGLSTSVVNGKIYAIGGVESDDELCLSTVEVYDPVTDTWTSKADMMPTARQNFGTCVLDAWIYAIGGRSGPWPQVTGAVEVYQAVPWGFARCPIPADGALHTDTWVNLSWDPGDFAVSHNVYFGDCFDDVNDGLGDTFCGNQAISFRSVGLPGSPYPEGLVRGQTYYWRVDEVNDAESDSPWKGPVWSFTIQPQTAYNPSPTDGAESVDLNVELNWSAGVDTALHAVYFGDNFDDVNNAAADLSQRGSTYTQTNTTYSPGPLEFAKTYYWRVDELTGGRGAEIHKGDIWNFTTIDFLVVDDFEDYDIGNNEIWWSWKDGLGYAAHDNEPAYYGNSTGSVVGDENTDSYCEETIVHGGKQSMPIFYDNNQQGKLNYSEAEMTLSSRRDWTVEGVGMLTIWFHGAESNSTEPMYVVINDNAVVTHNNPNAAQIETWTQWDIDLQEFIDQGVDITDVHTIGLGFGDRNNPKSGGSGKMYFDDIRLRK